MSPPAKSKKRSQQRVRCCTSHDISITIRRDLSMSTTALLRDDTDFKRTRRRAISASAIGTALEWFDFSVYAALATIIGAQFFESDDPVHSFLSAVAVFGVGFLFRPLGA